VIGERVATGREITVSGVLILISASLITRTPRLVVIRPRLILITPRLVVIRPRLILIIRRPVAITRRAITDLISRTDKELGATRRTTRNPGHLAAGWTSHNLRHRLPLPPSERARMRIVAASSPSAAFRARPAAALFHRRAVRDAV